MSLAVLLATAAQAWGDRISADPKFDCAMRKLAYDYGKSLLPRMKEFESLFYALNLDDPNCKGVLTADRTMNLAAVSNETDRTVEIPSGSLFVHPQGDDESAGEEKTPLRTIAR